MTDCAVILVGGRGSRLGSLTAQIPKPLLPVAGRPFLFHVLDYLIAQQVKRVVLATGYLAGKFERTLGTEYRSLSICYSEESEALHTGGAMALALRQVESSSAFVLNGDTYFPADLAALADTHTAQAAFLSMALRRVPEASRYGSIVVDGRNVTAMAEKGASGPGLINGGIYLVDRAAFLSDAPAGRFSLERELLPQWILKRKVAYTIVDEYFIDIGIPADLERAERDLR